MIKVLFFAQIRETLQCKGLDMVADEIDAKATIPVSIPLSVKALKAQLAQRGDLWHLVFAEQEVLCAVNQVICDGDQPIQAGDEVAFFPPVTGG